MIALSVGGDGTKDEGRSSLIVMHLNAQTVSWLNYCCITMVSLEPNKSLSEPLRHRHNTTSAGTTQRFYHFVEVSEVSVYTCIKPIRNSLKPCLMADKLPAVEDRCYWLSVAAVCNRGLRAESLSWKVMMQYFLFSIPRANSLAILQAASFPSCFRRDFFFFFFNFNGARLLLGSFCGSLTALCTFCI